MKHFCIRLLAALGCLSLLLLAASCEKPGLSVTAYRGLMSEYVDLSSARTLPVSGCGAGSVNLFAGGDGILSRYLVGIPNPWYDAACPEADARGHYRYFFAEDGVMWFFNLECNCSGQ